MYILIPCPLSPERQQLLEEFKAWNELLTKIQQAELEALLVEDRVVFESLEFMEQKAHETRDSIAQALQRQGPVG